jgi:transposase
VANELGDRPDDGPVYIFINRQRDKCKLLQWQSGGFVLYYKRLERGRFELPRYDGAVKSLHLSYSQLVLLIYGLSIGHLQRRKRYKKMENAMV